MFVILLFKLKVCQDFCPNRWIAPLFPCSRDLRDPGERFLSSSVPLIQSSLLQKTREINIHGYEKMFFLFCIILCVFDYCEKKCCFCIPSDLFPSGSLVLTSGNLRMSSHSHSHLVVCLLVVIDECILIPIPIWLRYVNDKWGMS